ncbi:site-2 protease family protein [Thermodesulforhabdus norvegica]|uniref:Zn-dependent protease (Includes SpoIVFB) n=1 Tax=Thermodesulforhabdus norvegica TaxID=39841 RepID=A0A1I4U9Y5_9BACT|nr:site-2 protease family protein [Thermodesulforhabdus norvegica]SFM85788.1 Zn-dependent protease (includes SpoIVFB) [Thermodesulforhabdus norvegica]
MEWIIHKVTNAGIYFLPLLIGVMAHEIAHGWAAERLGDPTARLAGRISINPLVHIDPLGTVVLPLMLYLLNAPFLFGWAKPVPVRMELLHGGRRGMARVALCGPLTNLMLAALSSLVYHGLMWSFRSAMLGHGSRWFLEPLILMAGTSVAINLVLMIVNLVPIPPLDGGRILVGLLPENAAVAVARLERYGMFIILLLIVTDVWSFLLGPLLQTLINIFLG